MRVLSVYLGRKGGGALYSYEVTNALTDHCEIEALVSSNSEKVDPWRKMGIPHYEMRTYDGLLGFVLKSVDPGTFCRFREIVEQSSPDLIYYPMIHVWTPALNAVVPEIPKVLTVHDPVRRLGDSRILHMIQQLSIKQCQRVIVLSRAFVPGLISRGVAESHIDVVPHGEFSRYSNMNGDHPERDPLCLLFFGRITPYKGLDLLLDSFPLIRRAIPSVRLLIVGSGDFSFYRKSASRQTGVTVVNRWIDDHEVARYFRSAGILVAPYRDATQSGVIPTAYSFSIPVVTTDVGALREQVDDGVTGRIVPAGDPVAFASACVELLGDPLRCQHMGMAARAKAMHDWGWPKIAEGIFRCLERALV